LKRRWAKHSQEIKTFIFSENMNILLVLKHILQTRATAVSLNIVLYNAMPDSKAEGTAHIIRNDIKHYEINKFQRILEGY